MYIYIYIYIYRIQIIKVGKTINTINNNKNRLNRTEINQIIMTNNISITGCHLRSSVVYIYIYIYEIYFMFVLCDFIDLIYGGSEFHIWYKL